MNDITSVTTRYELAKLLGIKHRELTYLLYVATPNAFYTSFTIPKRNGGERQIYAPTGKLKYVQSQLYISLWNVARSNRNTNISHGFVSDRSITTNAYIHRNKYLVYNLDLKDFFPSIHFGRVKGYFEKNRAFKLSPEISTVLAQLTCYQGCLPQGAPTSPLIANMICEILDFRILKLAKKYRLDYTRYADDLTFSTNNHAFLNAIDDFNVEIEQLISSSGFTINHEKSNLVLHNNRQTVTGVTVNKKLNADSRFYKDTRAMAYHLYKDGTFFINGTEGKLSQLEGRLSFIDLFYRLDAGKVSKVIVDNKAVKLSGRQTEYKKFLFYTRFYMNKLPLIITEGKTDPRYIRAALKKHYANYPALIEKSDDYSYKISFYKRNSRLKRLFNISPNGGGAFSNFLSCYHGAKNGDSYFQYFAKFGRRPTNPVILLLDNEQECQSKPLYQFLSELKTSKIKKGLDSIKNELKTTGWVRIFDNMNLYLLTIPLTDGKNECEIEDLFTEETRQHLINGQPFDSVRKAPLAKDTFSKYIESNYMDINFDGFQELLFRIEAIIQDYHSWYSKSQLPAK